MNIRDLLLPRSLLRLPGRTIRLRLTIIYASLFLASGAGLLAVTYVLVREATDEVLVATRANGSSVSISEPDGTKASPAKGTKAKYKSSGGPARSAPSRGQAARDRALARQQRDAELRVLLEKSGIALGLMAALSILLGWFAAGRVLRPLRTLNERAREISATSLHKRLALAGPDDELSQLAGTFDDLLGRLEASFTAQRQFVANASHELRTPLARARTLAEVALGDPKATVGSLRSSHRRVLAAGQEQERLIDALLTLARSERGLDQREPFDLARVTDMVLAGKRREAEERGLKLHTTLEPAETSGDARLVERLVANLLDNALRYNRTHGRVEVTTTTTGGRAVLSVTNSGPIVPAAEVERLLQPFQRLGRSRTGQSDGIGLGLSIVKAIATAHGASFVAQAQPDGGLHIEVSFFSVGASDDNATDTSRESKDHRPVLLRRRRAALGPDDVPAETAPIR